MGHDPYTDPSPTKKRPLRKETSVCRWICQYCWCVQYAFHTKHFDATLSTLWWGLCGKQAQTQTQPSPKCPTTKNTKLQQSTLSCFSPIFTVHWSAGKNAKLPGYMDYLHLSTADVAILKGSWSVLEEHVTRVSAGESLPTILSWAEKPIKRLKSRWKKLFRLELTSSLTWWPTMRKSKPSSDRYCYSIIGDQGIGIPSWQTWGSRC